MKTQALVSRYIAWLLLLAFCIYAFDAGAISSIGASIPIEVFSIILAGLLLLASYLLSLTNMYFRLILWIVFILSTSPLVLFALITLAGANGTVISVLIYAALISGMTWWQFRRKREQ